jgi:hypothetical protein
MDYVSCALLLLRNKTVKCIISTKIKKEDIAPSQSAISSFYFWKKSVLLQFTFRLKVARDGDFNQISRRNAAFDGHDFHRI